MKVGDVYFLRIGETIARGITLTIRRIDPKGGIGTLNVLGEVVGALRVGHDGFEKHWQPRKEAR